MLKFVASVTQKGQVTLPKKLRDKYGIAPMSKVLIGADNTGIHIESTQDITHLAGTFVPSSKKPIMKAREAMEVGYKRSRK
jgi:AbrB family looped-hinge helix DNA binding protein